MTFIEGVCKIAKKYVDFSKFESNLEKFLQEKENCGTELKK